jgi:hypothetical protein
MHEPHVAIERVTNAREAEKQSQQDTQRPVSDASRTDPAAQQVRRTEEPEREDQAKQHKPRDYMER